MSSKYPVTQAVRVLRAANVAFEAHEYAYVDKGGTATSSAALGVPEHQVIKTLVLEDDAKEPLIVLMHGDKQVSTRNLARQIGVRSVQPCKPEVADRHSGYQVGGTSPFGTRRTMKVYMERTILDLPRIWINGGRRGFLVSLDPKEAARVLAPVLVDVATDA
jgi:Cys-tRNA(Pro) deacylase